MKKDVVVYRTMSEEKAEEKALELNGKVKVSNTSYQTEAGMMYNVYEVHVEKEEEN